MYYEEAIINGILCCRTTPGGLWFELSKEGLTERIISLKEENARLEVETHTEKNHP